MPIPAGGQGGQGGNPSCFQRIQMGFMMGMCVTIGKATCIGIPKKFTIGIHTIGMHTIGVQKDINGMPTQ